MYFTNPVVLAGVVFVGIGLMIYALGWFARTDEMQIALRAAVKTAVIVGAVMAVLGAGLGVTHRKAHADCRIKVVTKGTPQPELEQCKYFFEQYGE